MKVRLALAAAVLIATALPAAAQTAEQWIAKARARLGSESALQGVTSVHFTGTLEVDGTNRRAMDIIFQKPLQQRITLTGAELSEVIALDDYDAWQKSSNTKNPTQWQLKLLDAVQTKRLRAQAWDNLNFLTGTEKLRGTVQVGGDVTVDGLSCVKLVFTYYGSITLTRYFEKDTARLIKTETEAGVEIREEGEMIVNGIRFPRKVSNREKSGRTVTMNFDKIVLNEKHPASEFAVPAMQAN
jgi:outer membrane lipoprotein-sorting protein